MKYGLKISGFSFSSRLLYALLRGPICFLKNYNIFNRFVYRRMRLYARERGTSKNAYLLEIRQFLRITWPESFNHPSPLPPSCRFSWRTSLTWSNLNTSATEIFLHWKSLAEYMSSERQGYERSKKAFVSNFLMYSLTDWQKISTRGMNLSGWRTWSNSCQNIIC